MSSDQWIKEIKNVLVRSFENAFSLDQLQLTLILHLFKDE